MSQKSWTEDKDDGLVPRNGHMEFHEQRGEEAKTAAGTQRGRLIAEMQAERERNSNLRVGSPNRMAKYDMGASAKVYGLRALATIIEIMENEKENSAVRLAAAKEVLDRGFGRPKQVTEVSGVDGDEIRNRLVIEFVGVPRKEPRDGFGAERESAAPEPRAESGGRGEPVVADARVNSGVPGGWQAAQEREAQRRATGGRAVAREAIRTQTNVNAAWAHGVNFDVEDVENNREGSS